MELIDVRYSDAPVEDMKSYPFPRFIFSSSPDRGLDTLLQLFPEIRKVFPQATLHIFYGFDNWDASLRENTNGWRQSIEWRNSIVTDANRLQDEGMVVHYGSRSQAELAEAMKAADVWFYPTNFTETFCITALEAMMSDTVIVCTKLAGLIATVGDRGILIEGEGDQPAYTEEYRNRALSEVCAILRDDKRRTAMIEKAKAWAMEQTWTNRAKEWLAIFNIAPQTPAASYYDDVAKLKVIYDPAYYPAK